MNDLSFRNGNASDLFDDINIDELRQLPIHDEEDTKKPFSFCNGPAVDYSERSGSFRNGNDSMEFMEDYVMDKRHQALVRQSDSHSGREVSFRNLQDVIERTKRTSLRDMKKDTCHDEGGAVFESFRNLNDAIQQAMDNSIRGINSSGEKSADSILLEEGDSSSDTDDDRVANLPDRRSFMKTSSWKKYGCSSEQSYRDLKMAMQASLEDVQCDSQEEGPKSIHVERGGRRRSIIDDLMDEGTSDERMDAPAVDEIRELPIDRNVPSNRRSSWMKHGCNSEQSYRDVKMALEAPMDDLGVEPQDSHVEKRGKRRSVLDDMLDEGAQEEELEVSEVDSIEARRKRESMARHGCSSEQSYSNLKMAMEVSMDDLHVEKRVKRRSVLDDMLEEGAEEEEMTSPTDESSNELEEPDLNIDSKASKEIAAIDIQDTDSDEDVVGALPDRRLIMKKPSCEEHGCSSEQSFRVLKAAMQASLDDVDKGRQKVSYVGYVQPRDSVLDDMLNEGAEEEDLTEVSEVASTDARRNGRAWLDMGAVQNNPIVT
jgi:hypothetical protein